MEGDGGYEGQFDLSAKRPLIVDMEICDTVKNPLEAEGSLVDAFCEANGGMVMFTKDGEDDSETVSYTHLHGPSWAPTINTRESIAATTATC